jgi:hypothetical protein
MGSKLHLPLSRAFQAQHFPFWGLITVNFAYALGLSSESDE